MEEIGGIIVYEGQDGLSLKVSLDGDTVWLTQAQLAELFGKNRDTVSWHLKNIFKEGELDPKSVTEEYQVTAADGKSYPTLHYNLDAIISVGYRVNSKRGTQFRIWATDVLKRYLTQGYALNQRLLEEERTGQLQELRQAIELLQGVAEKHELAGDEVKGLLEVITGYARSWVILQQYDGGVLPTDNLPPTPSQPIEYGEVGLIIQTLKQELMRAGEAGELFGIERGTALRRLLGAIGQSFAGVELYPSIEEKAAHLLYFLIKDHPFVDGNKRIGSLLFIWFLQRNQYLLNRFGERKVNDNALVALALLVAESRPQQKDTMVALTINLIGRSQ